MARRRLFNLANCLTLSRFAAAPVLLGLLLALSDPARDPQPSWLAAGIFALLGLTLLTDLFDGWVARARQVVTDFGKIMDPVADSTLFLTLLFGFAAAPRFREEFPVWIPVLVLYREVAIQVLRRYGALRGKVLAAKWSGKAKMAVQSTALLLALAAVAASDLRLWVQPEARLNAILFWSGILIAAVNLLSLIEYLRDVPELVREWKGEADIEEA